VSVKRTYTPQTVV